MIAKIPFKPRFKEAMISGSKTWASRTKRYGKPGDTFEAFNHEFEILKVERRTLEDIAMFHWRDEGCISEVNFRALWSKLHPRKGFVPSQRVYAHIFRRISL